MKLFTIKSTNIWEERDDFQCWELQQIPRQLSLVYDPIVLYEVQFSKESTIVYTDNCIKADKCSLHNPRTVDAFLKEHNLWKESLRHSGYLIQYYKGVKAEEHCIEAVKQNGLALEYIEAPYQTEEICLYAVHTDWTSLQYVANQTERVCTTAIEQNGKAIQYVREMTPELCSLAIRKGGGVEFLQTMPLEVCRMAVERNGHFLKYIPEEKQTDEICTKAIENNPFCLELVRNQTEDQCLMAVKKNAFVLQYVNRQTAKVCMTALEHNGFALQFVKEYMLPKLCDYAVEHQIEAIEFVKRKPMEEVWNTGFVWGIATTICVTIVLKTIFAKKA